MADQKISELTALTGADAVDGDEFVIVDTSTGETKRMVREEVPEAIGLSTTDNVTFQGGTFTAVVEITNDAGLEHVANGTTAGNSVPNYMRTGDWAGDFDVWGMRAVKDGTALTTKEFKFDFDDEMWQFEDQVGVAAGTAALPGIVFNNDFDTGMYRTGTNSIGFSTGGTLVLTLDASQNATFAGNITSLGIDDNATAERLQIADSLMTVGASGTDYVIAQATNTDMLTISGGSAGNAGINMQLYSGSHATKASDFHLRAGATDELTFINGTFDFQNNHITTTGDVTTTGAVTANEMVFPPAGELTIASGVITITGSNHDIDTEADAATDDLDTINGGVEGQILILQQANNGRDVTIKDNTGNINIAGDCVFGTVTDNIMLIYRSSVWHEISRNA